jgi:phosphoglycolate phosphatase-like HAD superfamily hydrolase
MLENEKYDDIDTLIDDLQDAAREIEVIYYHNAIEYLAENDASLVDSLGIAHEMGYTTENLNSELLATLLKQQNVSEKIEEYRDELEEVLFSE